MKKMRKKFQFLCVACMCLSVLTPYTSAGTVTATSTVDPVTYAMDDGTGAIQDYYKYTITLEWNYSELGTGSGLSHLDLDLSLGLLCPDALVDPDGADSNGNIRFEDPLSYQVDNGEGGFDTYYYTTGIDGYSNSEDYPGNNQSVQWGGAVDSGVVNTLRYQQPLEDDLAHPDPSKTEYSPDAVGEGEFWFYSVFAPQTNTGGITLKLGTDEYSHDGALTGDLPYCVPEPATMGLLGLGGLLLRRRRA